MYLNFTGRRATAVTPKSLEERVTVKIKGIRQ